MSTTRVTPYLTFRGRCEEALDFYRSALGAEVSMIIRFNESPEPPPPGALPEGWDRKIMHSTFKIGESVLMATDGGCGPGTGFEGITLALTLADEAAVRRAYEALADGGQPQMPLAKTFWSPLFGMVADRFGLTWMVSVEPAS